MSPIISLHVLLLNYDDVYRLANDRLSVQSCHLFYS